MVTDSFCIVYLHPWKSKIVLVSLASYFGRLTWSFIIYNVQLVCAQPPKPQHSVYQLEYGGGCAMPLFEAMHSHHNWHTCGATHIYPPKSQHGVYQLESVVVGLCLFLHPCTVNIVGIHVDTTHRHYVCVVYTLATISFIYTLTQATSSSTSSSSAWPSLTSAP